MSDILDEMTLLKDEVSTLRKVTSVTLSKILGNYWLFITVSLFVISLLLHQVPLLLVSLLFFLTGGVARLWDHYCLDRVEYRRRLSADRVFFGDEVQLEIELSNRKPMPLPWVQMDDELPSQVSLLKGRTTPAYEPGRMFLSNLLSLGWYHKVRRRYHMRCMHRGFFAFGPSRIRSGDLFGVFNQEMEIHKLDYLMVYPRILPLEKLGIPSNQPVGDIRTRRHIFKDPLLISGIRDYQSGDNMKQIHWKATARLGKLQTKVFEPTTTIDMGIFLDVRTTKPAFWGTMPLLLELGIITAASISKHAMDAGYRVGLYVNQQKRFIDELVRIPPSQHTDQMLHILEALAQIDDSEAMPISRLVANEIKNFPWGSSVVVITAMPTDSLLSIMFTTKRAGRSVVLITVGGSEPTFSKDGLTVYHVSEDVAWRELDMVSLR